MRAPLAAGNAAGSRQLVARLAFAIAALSLLAALFLTTPDALGAKKKKKDKRSPFVVKSVTVDSDGNGRVDGVMLTYSEKVRVAKIKKGKGKAKKKNRKLVAWSAGSRTFGGAKVQSGGKNVLVKISEGTAVNTAELTPLTYRRVPKGATGLTDRAGNQALAALIKPRDGLPPVLTSAGTLDTNTNGRIDTIRVRYSEPVSMPAPAQFVVAGYVVTGAAASGDSVDVSIAEQSVDTNAQPAVAAIAGAVSDTAGNAQGIDQSVTAADGAPPAVIDSVTADTNGNGRIDRITVRFSELITHALETGAGAVSADGFLTVSVSTGMIDTVVVEIDDSIGGSNTNLVPNVATAATSSPVKDAAGNALGTSSYTATRDGAAPVLVSASTRDIDTDGLLDAIAARFSEPVTYTAGGSPYFSSTTTELGTFSAAASGSGATVTAIVNEVSAPAYNTDLPRLSPSVPLPITYTAPVSGGAVDDAGIAAATKTIQATDGAGPAIVYAETVDDNPVDGRIDGVDVGFSEPIVYLGGNPFTIATGSRQIEDEELVSTDGTTLITGGSPGQPLYKGVTIQLYPLTTNGLPDGPLADPDGADLPTIDYATIRSGGTKTDFAEDASHNEVVATGSTPFYGITDRVKPLLRSLHTRDSVLNGYVDQLDTVWSEPVLTDGTPNFAALSPQNGPPTGYTPPTIGTATVGAASFTVPLSLTPSTSPDRDMIFQSQYVPAGAGDTGITDVAGNTAATSPVSPIDSAPLCSDRREQLSAGQDDATIYANDVGLATVDTDYLGTLCGADIDYYSFTAGAGETVKVLFALSEQALLARASFSGYNPFDAFAPGGGSVAVTSSFDSDIGWYGQFTTGASGVYKIGVRDTNTPLLDYGYCVSRTSDGSTPVCTVRQGDLVITEVLGEISFGAPSVGPYVEIKNVSGSPVTIDSNYELTVGGVTCQISPQSGTNTTVGIDEIFYVSTVNDSGKTNDFSCSSISGSSISLTQPVSIGTIAGVIDSVDLSSANIPITYSAQLRAQSSWETSSANDNLAGGWCTSLDAYGSWGTANNDCDEFRVNEVGFLPFTSSRDGQVYVEIKGNGAVTPSATLLAGWRVRIKPQGMSGAFFLLPSTANPTSNGYFLLADSPAVGSTQVPLFSMQSSAVTTAVGVDGRNMDQHLRADRPVTVKLMRPTGGDPYTCNAAAADTLGFVPNTVGSQTMTEDDGVCGAAYVFAPFGVPSAGYVGTDAIQRSNERVFSNDNSFDFCARTASPMQQNQRCQDDS